MTYPNEYSACILNTLKRMDDFVSIEQIKAKAGIKRWRTLYINAMDWLVETQQVGRDGHKSGHQWVDVYWVVKS